MSYDDDDCWHDADDHLGGFLEEVDNIRNTHHHDRINAITSETLATALQVIGEILRDRAERNAAQYRQAHNTAEERFSTNQYLTRSTAILRKFTTWAADPNSQPIPMSSIDIRERAQAALDAYIDGIALPPKPGDRYTSFPPRRPHTSKEEQDQP